jgi:hypothetical protein
VQEICTSSSLRDATIETYELEGRALRVLQAARWAEGSESAHLFQRIGDALRDDEFELAEEAKSMYARGIELDTSLPRLHAGLARAIAEFGNDDIAYLAVPHIVKATELAQIETERQVDAQQRIETVEPIEAERQSSDVLAAERFLAECRYRTALYSKVARDPDLAERMFECVLENWESLPPYAGLYSTISSVCLFRSLHERRKFEAASSLLRRIVSHPQARTLAVHPVYTRFIEAHSGFIQVAYETDTFEELNNFCLNGLQSCARFGNDGEVGAIRLRQSFTTLLLCPSHTDEAVSALTAVLRDAEVNRPSNEYHWVRPR